MKRNVIALALVAALLCSLCPALALEPQLDDAAFCDQKGILVKSPSGEFNPDEPMTYNQCVHLALQLYDILHGGDGGLGPAPADWGAITLTLADGTQLTGRPYEKTPLPGAEGVVYYHSWWIRGMQGSLESFLTQFRPDPALSSDDPAYAAAEKEMERWGKAHEGPATITFGDQTISGKVYCIIPVGWWGLNFETSEDETPLRDALRDDQWLDSTWYLSQHPELAALSFWEGDRSATRRDFAEALYAVVGELPPVRQVDAPGEELDRASKAVYSLYAAGVLGWKNAYGVNGGEARLTCGEAATIAARVLDESRRVAGVESPFADVSPDAWYAQGVAACAENGIMIGDEKGLFHPEERLSQAECLTLAFRMFAPGKTPNTAPQFWGAVRLELEDGTQLMAFGSTKEDLPGVEGGQISLYWGSYRHDEPGYLCVNLLGDEEVCKEWGKAHEGKATVQVDNLSDEEHPWVISGTVECFIPLGNWVLAFHPDSGDGGEEAQAIRDTLALDAPSYASHWVRNTYYTAYTYGLKNEENYPGFARLMEGTSAQRWATREMFAAALGDVWCKGDGLPQRVEVADIPDESFAAKPYLKNLYEGGILNGVDEYGAFNGGGFLTRAQAAVMVARLLDEDQRLSAPIKPLPTDGYTITETGETWDEVYGDKAEEFDPYPALKEGPDGLYGYVDQAGDWVLLPQWEGVESFLDGYAVVYEDGRAYVIDDMGHTVLGDGYDFIATLGEGKFWCQSWAGKGYEVEVRDVRGNTFSPAYSQSQMRFHNGYAAYEERIYIDANLRPVSQWFDRCGALDENHSGLVELDGKVFRIQFD